MAPFQNERPDGVSTLTQITHHPAGRRPAGHAPIWAQWDSAKGSAEAVTRSASGADLVAWPPGCRSGSIAADVGSYAKWHCPTAGRLPASISSLARARRAMMNSHINSLLGCPSAKYNTVSWVSWRTAPKQANAFWGSFGVGVRWTKRNSLPGSAQAKAFGWAKRENQHSSWSNNNPSSCSTAFAFSQSRRFFFARIAHPDFGSNV